MLTTLLLWLALSPVAAVLIGRVLLVMGDGAGDMAGPCATPNVCAKQNVSDGERA